VGPAPKAANIQTEFDCRSLPRQVMQGPRITAVERMRSVVACRTVRNGTAGGSRDQNPTTILLLDRVQLETGGVGKESLDMARGRSHLFSIIKHFFSFMFWAISATEPARKLRENPLLMSAEAPAVGSDCTAHLANDDSELDP
jgi:hypothetical protein